MVKWAPLRMFSIQCALVLQWFTGLTNGDIPRGWDIDTRGKFRPSGKKRIDKILARFGPHDDK